MAISAKKFRNDLKKSGIFYTDQALAEEIKALLPDDITEVYDPTCGDGSLLRVFDDDVKKYGQDILAEQVECAREQLENFEGYIGDTLMAPAFEGRKFKAIVANPPFSVKWEPDALKEDIRFSCAPIMPPASKADYAFILHILHFLDDDGIAAVLNFPGILYRGQREGKIREWIIKQNWIDKVIHIPGGHFEDTNIATALIVFRKNKTSTDIEFVDTENNISRIVPFSEIEENGFNLSVSTYVQPEIEKPVVDPVRLQNEAREQFKKSLQNDLEVDLTVCILEAGCGKTETAFSFIDYLQELQFILSEYIERTKMGAFHDQP